MIKVHRQLLVLGRLIEWVFNYDLRMLLVTLWIEDKGDSRIEVLAEKLFLVIPRPD